MIFYVLAKNSKINFQQRYNLRPIKMNLDSFKKYNGS
jgi:hypothetical protein